MPYVTQNAVPEDDCGICSESLTDPTKAVFKLDCGHCFHNDCLNNLCNIPLPQNNIILAPRRRCPICRAEFDPEECITFWAFKEGALNFRSLPQEVQNIYLTAHPEMGNVPPQNAGKYKRSRKSKRSKKRRYTRRR